MAPGQALAQTHLHQRSSKGAASKVLQHEQLIPVKPRQAGQYFTPGEALSLSGTTYLMDSRSVKQKGAG